MKPTAMNEANNKKKEKKTTVQQLLISSFGKGLVAWKT